MTMTFPTIHRNGTSRESLKRQYEEATNGVQHAIETVSQSAPNARDYYPQSDSAINQAIREHTARLEKLQAIRKELVELWESVLD
jgi:hypothetical protein